MERVFTYIDGFNLYYGLKKDWRRYLWLDLVAMSKTLLKPGQEFIQCKYFSSPILPGKRGDQETAQKVERQKIWLKATETRRHVSCHYGKHQKKPMKCEKCQETFRHPEEKMTDVNIACHLLVDAYEDEYDAAWIISGDSDLSTVITMVQRKFYQKRVFIAFPPGRESKDLGTLTGGTPTCIGEDNLKQAQLPDEILRNDGSVLRCPDDWR